MEKQTKQKNKWISFLADGMLSGIMIGIGGVVSLSSDNRYIGALLFSLGLFCIVQFQYGLYTGKVGYIVNREPAFIAETLVTLVGNTLGAAVAALLIRLTRFASDTNVVNLDVTIVERAQTTVDAKLSDYPLSAFILAVFCGLLMFSAVESNRICSKKGNYPAALFGVVMPILVFIICGFNHCIADLFYYFLAGCPSGAKAAVYIPVVILGNAAGGMLIPLLKKCSNQPL